MVLLAFLVLGLDLVTRRKTLVWPMALIGLIVPTLLTFSLAFNWFGDASDDRLLRHAGSGQVRHLLQAALPGDRLRRDPGLVPVRREVPARARRANTTAIILMSLAGMMLMGSTGELITIYISLELTSIPLYILAGLSRTRCALGGGGGQVCAARRDVVGDSALWHGAALRRDRHDRPD